MTGGRVDNRGRSTFFFLRTILASQFFEETLFVRSKSQVLLEESHGEAPAITLARLAVMGRKAQSSFEDLHHPDMTLLLEVTLLRAEIINDPAQKILPGQYLASGRMPGRVLFTLSNLANRPALLYGTPAQQEF